MNRIQVIAMLQAMTELWVEQTDEDFDVIMVSIGFKDHNSALVMCLTVNTVFPDLIAQVKNGVLHVYKDPR